MSDALAPPGPENRASCYLLEADGPAAARAGAGRLMLTHVPPWYDPVRSLEEASAVAYDGPVSLAAAGDCFDVG